MNRSDQTLTTDDAALPLDAKRVDKYRKMHFDVHGVRRIFELIGARYVLIEGPPLEDPINDRFADIERRLTGLEAERAGR